jgi:hypothetical protein
MVLGHVTGRVDEEDRCLTRYLYFGGTIGLPADWVVRAGPAHGEPHLRVIINAGLQSLLLFKLCVRHKGQISELIFEQTKPESACHGSGDDCRDKRDK